MSVKPEVLGLIHRQDGPKSSLVKCVSVKSCSCVFLNYTKTWLESYCYCLTSADASKLERIHQTHGALCFIRLLPRVHYSYALDQLKLSTLLKSRYHLDALFLTHVNLCSDLCSLLRTVGLQVPARYIRDFSLSFC
jgi:hypothetical protein